jgi:uncharacterized GH25 family protein
LKSAYVKPAFLVKQACRHEIPIRREPPGVLEARMKRLSLALALALWPRLASAHDFWIEPSTFHPARGVVVSAALRVGVRLQGEPVPRMPMLINRFVLRSKSGEAPLVGITGEDPAGSAQVRDTGLQWIGYQSNASPVTLEAKKFEDYLREEGLERVIELRAKNGQSASPGRERFYRCAKALLESGSSKGETPDGPLGFTLELVPRTNPYATRIGGELPLTLLFRGEPIANVLIVAMNRQDPEKTVRARTDAKGQVTLRLPRPGFWLVKAVHMEAAKVGAGADWESWWASLTFDLSSTVGK